MSSEPHSSSVPGDPNSAKPVLPEASGPRRREPRKRGYLWLWGLVVLVLLGVATWKWVVPGLKAQRARQFSEEATALMRRNDYEGAFSKVLAALRFAPQDPQVLRTAATLCLETGHPNGLRYYESLIRSGAATPEDRRNLVQLALALRRIDIAARELQPLLKASPNDLTLLHLMIQQQQEARDLTKATQTAGYALSLFPGDPQTQLVYGSLLIRNATNSMRAMGRRMLLSLVVGEGRHADAAAEVLMLSPELADSDVRLLMRDLQSRTNQRPIDVLRVAELKLRLEPGQTNAVVRETFLTMTATNRSVELLALVGQWALQKRQSDLVLEQIPADVARTNANLAPIRAYALAQESRWNELAPMIDDRRFPLDPVVANVLRAEMALASGNRTEAEAALRTALEQPKLPLDRIRLVARSAEAAGFPLVAVSAYQRMFGMPGQGVQAALEILRVLGPVDDLSLVRDTLKKLNEQLPGDDGVAAERAWAELLLKSRLKESRALAERLASTRSNEVQWKFLLALSRLRDGRAADALALVDSEASKFDDLKPRWQAVFVAALGANEQREAARTFAARTDQSYLRSAEKDLIKPYLAP